MNVIVSFFKNFIEKSVFGVCSKIADYIGVRTTRVRLYFIYVTFLTLGSPIILYVIAAFWMNIKKYIRNGRNWLLD